MELQPLADELTVDLIANTVSRSVEMSPELTKLFEAGDESEVVLFLHSIFS